MHHSFTNSLKKRFTLNPWQGNWLQKGCNLPGKRQALQIVSITLVCRVDTVDRIISNKLIQVKGQRGKRRAVWGSGFEIRKGALWVLDKHCLLRRKKKFTNLALFCQLIKEVCWPKIVYVNTLFAKQLLITNCDSQSGYRYGGAAQSKIQIQNADEASQQKAVTVNLIPSDS